MKILILLLTGLVIGIYTYKQAPPIFKTYSVKVETVKAVEPTPTPTPSDAEVMGEIIIQFAEHDRHELKKIIDVAYGESGLRWNALNHNTNGSTDHGCFQINSIHTKRFGEGFKTDYKENIRVAHLIYDEQGLSPWVVAYKLGYIN